MIPTTVVDNFFKNPDYLYNLSQELDYKKQKQYDDNYPGYRTDCLSIVVPEVYHAVLNKFTTLYTTSTTQLECHMHFQKITGNVNMNYGLPHTDPFLTTGLVYLSKGLDNQNCGTSFFEYKKFPTEMALETERSINQECYDKKFRDLFTETLNVKYKYNRMLSFSGEHLHAQNELNMEEERITLIWFISNWNLPESPLMRCNHASFI